MLLNKQVQEMPYIAGNRWKAGNGRHIPTRLSIYHWGLLIFTASIIFIGSLLCCKVFRCRKMKNMTTVLIFQISVCDGKPGGDKMFINSIGQKCSRDSSLYLQSLCYSKAWNRPGCKQSGSGHLFQGSLHSLTQNCNFGYTLYISSVQ